MQFDASVANGLTTIQPGDRRAVRSIRSMALWPLAIRGIFISAREGEFQTRRRFPARFQFGAFHRGVEIQIDRRAVHNFRNLIILVIVIEDIAVQRQRAVEQRVLGAQFIGIDEFRLERKRMNGFSVMLAASIVGRAPRPADWRRRPCNHGRKSHRPASDR